MKAWVNTTACSYILVLAFVQVSGAARPAAAAQDEVTLFTEQEAQDLRIHGDNWDPTPRARSAAEGPHVVIRIPEIKRVDGSQLVETVSPTDLVVDFEENQAPVDMSSLDVKARKGIFSKSLTDKLKPFLQGTTLDVDNIEVPSGKYQIQIRIKDLEGKETLLSCRLIVKD